MTEADRLSLSDPDTFQDPERVHRIFTQLRSEDPVAWCPEIWGRGFWAVTKYDDIQYVSKNPQLFSSDGHLGGITLPDQDEIDARVRAQEGYEPQRLDLYDGGRSMIMIDPPEHTGYRRLVAPGFTPSRLTLLEEQIQVRVTNILDKIADRSECEFVESVAAELPIQMLAELFDVPQDDRHQLFEWSNIVIGGEDPDISLSREYVINAFMEMAMYGINLGEQRKKEPGDDLITMLVQPNAEGEMMTTEDYVNTFMLLVVAGNETTRNSISGGVLALSQFPEQRQKLLDDPSLIPSAVNEIMRWVTPVVYMRRTALADTSLRGKPIKQGDKLAMWYMAGNRDEEVFSNPFTFDVSRDEARHLSFGYGQHLCIGWRLAEIQLTVVLTELLQRFPDLAATGEVVRMRSNFLNSIKRLPVTFTPQRTAA
jgi:cytochrome P450|tara:strand:+ start:8941 stop:10215 length:1275 start_codon:yes stop_codon:yes gene_type:complete